MHFAWTAQKIMENTDVSSLENSNKLNLQEPPIGENRKAVITCDARSRKKRSAAR